MTSATSASAAARPADVVVFDLRDWRDDRPVPAVSGLVVALDNVDTLLEHRDAYFSLVDDAQVYGLICVAIGQSADPARSGDGVVLKVPQVLPHGAGTVLWVGDEHGVRWGEAQDRPRPVEPALPSGLHRLVEALRVPEVFEHVRAATAEFAGRTASPGLQLVSGAVDAGDLSQARAAVVRRLTDPDAGAVLPPALQDPAGFAAGPSPPAAVLVEKRPVDAGRVRAVETLGQAEESAQAMGSWRGLFGENRPGKSLGGQLVDAAQAAEQYRRVLVELLRRIDGQLRVRQPPVEDVVAMGVRPPTPAQHENVASSTQELVRSTLHRQPSLTTLAAQLWQAAPRAAPQGCTRAWRQLDQRDPIHREVPEFRPWPLWLWTRPLALLSCFAVAFVPGSWVGYVLGAVFALAWFGSGWFLLARRPDASGEYGLLAALPSALFNYGLAGLLGAAAGVVLVNLLPSSVRLPASLGYTTVAVAAVLLVVVVAVSWPTAVRRWTKALGLPELRADVVEMTTSATAVVAAEWLPAERRRAVAEAFAEAATGLEEISTTLCAEADQLFRASDPSPSGAADGLARPVLPELLAVVGTDLLDLSQECLRPAWQAIGSGRHNPEGVYAQRTARLLAEYRAHAAGEGLMAVPAFVSDSGPRDRLIARQWSESPAAVVALRCRLPDQMTQLCQARQLTSIDREAGGRLLRFAPKPVQRVLEADPVRNQSILQEPMIWTSAGELAGVLRLLPLRLGSVREHHAGGRHE